MSIDLSQFFEVFFEESFEGLDAMEAELLNLVPGEEDLETINTIFRAAHSIKGGSGTFGFNSVSDFTHVLETLLDQIREGKRELTAEHVNLLLKAVDCLRALLSALQAEQDPNLEDAIALRIKFEEILGVNQSGANKVAAEEQPAQPEFNTYQIDFKPHHHLFKTGNEPLYMISELAELGDLETLAFHNELPDITDLSADDCFLSWRFFLNTVKDESAIREIFEWVEDDADISITLCGGLFAEQQQATIEEPAVENIESSPEVAEVAEVVAVNPSKKAATAKVTTPAAAESTSIRVGIDKVDSLINMVGELVITQAMLSQIGEQEITETTIASLQEGLAQLAHNTRDLQESVMRIHMYRLASYLADSRVW